MELAVFSMFLLINYLNKGLLMNCQNTFQSDLKQHRLSSGLSLKALSNQIKDTYGIDISTSMLFRYENDAQSIPFNILWVLSDFFNIDLNKHKVINSASSKAFKSALIEYNNKK
ncbi:hypothetical protein FC70_GL000209 [Paucilactobacillus oligofermentans DSM 15707 = LMG 22743]|uniref:HTH cro/C1-type domain-containing protein n=1 Tax=Paucilactobacillus oligofermentans DSM 15707 = LMG 22743 TaxID=1423778 RepID=A0A0R1RTW7_9LACO|nr:helix-turn-helix transcriptional regulator [Paucilactobacillus oligofermentans]KRL57738.1 hypothetical protein FC70_GL000209 [Paucilactobacillus oligofermentans DSM 15707 = LMG 22743]